MACTSSTVSMSNSANTASSIICRGTSGTNTTALMSRTCEPTRTAMERGSELGGLELQRVFARRDILDEEITPLIGHHGHVARRHRNLHAVEGHTPRTRNDPAPDAAVLCKGGQRGDGEY